MKVSYSVKVTMSVIVFMVMAVFTFGLSLITALNGDGHYVPLMLLTSLTIYVLIVFWFFGLFKIVKIRNMYMIGLAVLWILGGAKLAFYTYHENVDSVSAEVDLSQYEPNKEGTKAVTLDKQASLQLPKDNLIRLDGATALYPLYSAFVQATYPKQVYTYSDPTVRSTKSDSAYRNLVK